MNNLINIAGKPVKIYAEILEDSALEQFESAMCQDFVVKGALMPDAHTGYSLPIGGVIATKDVIVPSWVGYDIGCGMCALKTEFKKEDIIPHKEKIFSSIYEVVPTGMKRNQKKEVWNYNHLKRTPILEDIFEKEDALTALATLGGGNHFIEIGYDEEENVWIIIHSGSRKLGHAIASYYMLEAKKRSIDTRKIEEEFESKNKDFKIHNPEKFEESKKRYIDKQVEQEISGRLEGHFGFDINTKIGKSYITDLNFCLEFALENRKRMIDRVYQQIYFYVKGKKSDTIDFSVLMDGQFINRNHNHAELNQEGLWIHRKGATHAEKGMYGVIPGNMKHGSFIVRGKGNTESLSSSSHGAGRVLSRSEASEKITLEEFENSMNGITAKVEESTKDESVFAYKNIFDVMDLQKDLVEIVAHINPLINIKT